MQADETIAVAILAADRAPDWPAAQRLVEQLTVDDLEFYFESGAPVPFAALGGGIEAFSRHLRVDLAQFRRAVERGDASLTALRVRDVTVYVARERDGGGMLHGAIARLAATGALAAAGFDDTRTPLESLGAE